MTLQERARLNYPAYPAYQRAWLAMVQRMGDKWLIAKPIKRKDIKQ